MHLELGALRQIDVSYRRIAELIEADRSQAIRVLEEHAGIDSLPEADMKALATTEKVVAEVSRILNHRIGLHFGSHGHSGSMVPLTADGPGSASFGGYYDNTEIAWKMAAVLGVMLGLRPAEQARTPMLVR